MSLYILVPIDETRVNKGPPKVGSSLLRVCNRTSIESVGGSLANIVIVLLETTFPAHMWQVLGARSHDKSVLGNSTRDSSDL